MSIGEELVAFGKIVSPLPSRASGPRRIECLVVKDGVTRKF